MGAVGHVVGESEIFPQGLQDHGPGGQGEGLEELGEAAGLLFHDPSFLAGAVFLTPGVDFTKIDFFAVHDGSRSPGPLGELVFIGHGLPLKVVGEKGVIDAVFFHGRIVPPKAPEEFRLKELFITIIEVAVPGLRPAPEGEVQCT